MGWYSSVCEIGLIYDMYDIPIDTEIAINSAEEQHGASVRQPRCSPRGVSLLCQRGLSEFELFAERGTTVKLHFVYCSLRGVLMKRLIFFSSRTVVTPRD